MVLYDAIGEGPHRCHWCGCGIAWGRNMHADHLDHDRARNTPENLVPACDRCNSRRWKTDPRTGASARVEKGIRG